MKKIDVHMHISLNQTRTVLNGAMLASVEEMLPIMDKYGIEKSILMSSGEKDVLMNNEEIRTICKKYPKRFAYLAMFDLEDLESLEERILKEMKLGAKGVGEFTTNVAFDDPRMLELLEILEKHNLPLLFHMTPELGNFYGVYDEAGMPKLEYILGKFPNLKVVAHSQPFWYEMTEHESSTADERNAYPVGLIEKEGRVQELFRKYPNLYGDLSANSGGNAIMRDAEYGYKFLEEFKNKLMYGTDLYCVEQYFPLGDFLEEALASNKISQDAYDKITRENAKTVFGLAN